MARDRGCSLAGERFAGLVAHELRTPLATQRSLLELALADPDADAATWREIGGEVLEACRRQERLLEACLALARGTSRPEVSQRIDLSAVAAAALVAQDPCSLETVLALEPARMIGDRSLVERLVANLVSNAIQHNRSEGRIEVATGVSSGRALLSIVNTGPVIAPVEVPRLFEPFRRLRPQVGRASDGIGLGLAIVRAIADAHHATISAEANPGGGLDVEVAFAATG